MRWKPSELIVGLCALLIAFGAEAGMRRFDMTTDASSNGEGEIELEGWLDFGRPASNQHVYVPAVTNGMFWLGLRFGLLDNLELASFLVLEKKTFIEVQAAPLIDPFTMMEIPRLSEDQSGLMMWVTELRWRPVEVGKWPVDLFIQAQMVHWFERYHPTQFRFTLGASKNVGRFLFAANYSYWDSLRFASPDGKTGRWSWVEFSFGASANVVEADGWVPSVNLGIEGWGFMPNQSVTNHVHNHLLHGGGFVLGPTVSLARGRLWLTGHLGFPLAIPIIHPGDDKPTYVTDLNILVGRIMLGINI